MSRQKGERLKQIAFREGVAMPIQKGVGRTLNLDDGKRFPGVSAYRDGAIVRLYGTRMSPDQPIGVPISSLAYWIPAAAGEESDR
jgi:hypothetical protein